MLCAALLGACADARPDAPVVALATSGDTVTTHDSDVTGAAWLGGDRWALLAAPNETAAIADFSSRKITQLGAGRTRDLRNPTTLFVAADSLYVGDWGLRRTTVWTTEGRMVRAVPTSDAIRGSLPQARDAKSGDRLSGASARQH